MKLGVNGLMKALSSKRVWTIVVLVLINGFASVQSLLPAEYLNEINWVLGLLGVYFGIPKK